MPIYLLAIHMPQRTLRRLEREGYVFHYREQEKILLFTEVYGIVDRKSERALANLFDALAGARNDTTNDTTQIYRKKN